MHSPLSARILDSHCHLPASALASERDSRWPQVDPPDSGRYFCNTTCESEWQATLNLAGPESAIIPFLGIHPWFAETVTPGWEHRLLLLLQKNPAGLGETGLDKSCPVNFDRQQQVFLAQLSMAVELHRPLVIHCVKAWGRLLEILEALAAPRPAIMLHSFSGSMEIMQRLLALGCFISFSPRLISNRQLHPLLTAAPLTRLLLETDTAWHPHRPEPPPETTTISHLYQVAAALRGIPLPEFYQQVWNNGKIFAHTILSR